MLADLVVIVPTRGRPYNLRRLLEAWDDTDSWGDAELVAAVDADDPEIAGYRQVAAERAHTGRVSLFEVPQWIPMVAKLNQAAAATIGERFALGFMGDDHLPRTRGWVRRYLGTLYEMRTGIVYGDDGHWGGKLPTQWAMTADIVRALGRMVPAPVEHLYCDNSILALGLAAECIRYLPEVVIEHMHPVYGKADSDDQYRRVNSKDQYRRDGDAYQRWLLTQLDADAARVRALRGVKVGG